MRQHETASARAPCSWSGCVTGRSALFGAGPWWGEGGGAASRAEAMAVPGGGRAQLAHCGRCQGATYKQQSKEEKPGSNTQTTLKGGEAREQHTNNS